MKKQLRLRIIGKVQGVFYRAECGQYANAHGIKGWVHNNEEEETVEILAQGEENVLKNFIAWCWEGPAQSRVDDVEEKWEEVEEDEKPGDFKDFKVR